MAKYILKRLFLMLITASIIIFLVFVIVKSLPNEMEVPLGMDAEAIQAWRDREGIGRPIIEQFGMWIRNIFANGSFGISTNFSYDASLVLFPRIPATIKLNLIPTLLSIPIGIFLGSLAAIKKNKIADHAISTGVMIFISIPTFVIAMFAVLVFYFRLGWVSSDRVFPDVIFAENIWAGIQSYILPVTIMTIGSIAGWTRGIRAELTEQLTQEYMLLARSKGLSKRQATLRHSLKNAMVPFAPAIFTELIGLLTGSIIIESIFGVVGVGSVYLNALNQRDYPVLMLALLFFTVISLVSSVLADLSYGIVDPRIRIGGKKA